MGVKSNFVVKASGSTNVESVRAENHQDAAERYLARIARRDLRSRAYKPYVDREGELENGAIAWKGELWRRARDGNGWVTDEYRATFTTRERMD